MSQFIESIKLKDGQVYLLSYHEARMNRTRCKVLGLLEPISLFVLLQPFIKKHPIGLFKIRVLYDHFIDTIEIHPYIQRPINNLCIVKGNLDYSYKTTDRKKLQDLYNQRGDCDDILIAKEGLITDSYYANVAFFNGQTWDTPSTPLLKGVQRQYLLEQKVIQVKDIQVKDLNDYKQVKLFNAMMDWAHCPIIDTINIFEGT